MTKEIAKTSTASLESNSQAKAVAEICVNAALDKKATNVIALEVAELTSFTDIFVICSAPSERQVQAIVRNVEYELRDRGVRPQAVEGLETSSWVLLDLGDVVFHCFTDSAREYYDLEGFWIDAPKINFTS